MGRGSVHRRSNALRHAISILVAAVLVAVGLVTGLILLVVPRPPPASVPIPAPLGPPLTKHLVLVVVDGLRFDVGTDPARMPAFARRMREETSGEIWSSRVSMTSSAILTFGTGQRGDVDQIINNESGSTVRYNHLIGNARAAGLVTAATGDWAWFHMYKGSWSMARPDPQGVGIEVDYNPEIFEAAYRFIRSDPRPNLAVFHFVTPDHQAHVYGIYSERYRRHIAGFDRTLDELLRALPSDTTVVVTSDHGATDTGTHGSDTPIQRRSPIFAYGPGIAPGRREASPLDQVDIPGTLAALLGVAAPAHGRGHVLVEWLAIADIERARIACADLTRLSIYAREHAGEAALPAIEAASGACAAASPRERIERAASAARGLDQSFGQAALGGRSFGWLIPLFGFIAAATLAAFAIGRSSFPSARGRELLLAGAAFIGLTALSIGLMFGTELLPGSVPTVVRVALYTAGHGLLVVALFKVRAVVAFLDRRPVLGAVLVPGLLLVAPTRTTQVESFVSVVLIALAALTVGLPGTAPPAAPRTDSRPPWRRWAARPLVLAGVLAALAVFAKVGLRDTNFLPKVLYDHHFTVAFLSMAALGVARAIEAARRPESPDARLPVTSVPPRVWALAALGVAVAFTSLLLRRYAPAPLCLAFWLGLPFLAVLAWRRSLQPLGELLLYASYACVARDVEHAGVAATVLVASAVGRALAKQMREARGEPARPSTVLLLVTFLFAWGFLQRILVQTGVDFPHFDWAAGTFRDPNASVARIGAALVFKHAFVRMALLYAFFSPLAPSLRAPLARCLVAAEALRAGVLAVTLYACGSSFWTSLRAIGEVPHALTATVVAALALLAVTLRERGRAAGPHPDAPSADFVPPPPLDPDRRSAPFGT